MLYGKRHSRDRTVLFASRSSRDFPFSRSLSWMHRRNCRSNQSWDLSNPCLVLLGRGSWCGLRCSLPDVIPLGTTPTRRWQKLIGPRPVCGKLRFDASQERTPRPAKACAVGLSPGWSGGPCSSKRNASWQHRAWQPDQWNGCSLAWWRPGIGRSTL